MLAYDDEQVWLTRQPREAAGMIASLEIPAGKLDVPGEEPLACAQRELAEEIGRQAATWRELMGFYTSPGFSDERVWLFEATDLSAADGGAHPGEDERIEIVPWPLGRLDEAIAESEDAKTLIALFWLKARRTGA
jgi:ADP-ribose pyrophosphatase